MEPELSPPRDPEMLAQMQAEFQQLSTEMSHMI